jgi:hypothetical protein
MFAERRRTTKTTFSRPGFALSSLATIEAEKCQIISEIWSKGEVGKEQAEKPRGRESWSPRATGMALFRLGHRKAGEGHPVPSPMGQCFSPP